MSQDSIVLICAIFGVGLTLLGGIVHIVWTISKINTKVESLLMNEKMIMKVLDDHVKELNKHGNRLVALETKKGE